MLLVIHRLIRKNVALISTQCDIQTLSCNLVTPPHIDLIIQHVVECNIGTASRSHRTSSAPVRR